LLRMDRRFAQIGKRAELQNPVYSAAIEQHLELDQYPPDETANERRPRSARGRKSVLTAFVQKIRDLFLREPSLSGTEQGGGEKISIGTLSVDLVFGTGALLSKDRHLVGR